MTPTHALHWCGAALHATPDALGRTRLRCPDCDGIGEAGASQPTRAITQTPGAVCMAPLDPWDVPRFVPISRRFPLSLPTPADDGPVPRGVRFVPLTPTASAPVNDRPCIVCLNPVAPDVRSKVCDDCCPPGTRYSREQSRKARAALGFGLEEIA